VFLKDARKNETYLVVLGYILIPKHKFLRQGDSFRAVFVMKEVHGNQRSMDPTLSELFPNKESSFEGHTVNALVPTGEEGRDKLR
jgi:hypothetical protein